MNRSTLLAERRSRFLQAIRQTYNDFFHDYFINSGQIFRLRVRRGRMQPTPKPPNPNS